MAAGPAAPSRWLLTVLALLAAVAASAEVADSAEALEEASDQTCSAAGDCTGLLYLPVDSNATVELGDPDGEEATLESLHAAGRLPFVNYLRAQPGPQEGFGVKFRNFRSTRLDAFWDDQSATGVPSGKIKKMGRMATVSYPGHVFIFCDPDGEEVARFTMDREKTMYIVHPLPSDQEKWTTKESELYQNTLEEERFLIDYLKREGVPWLGFWPRGPPTMTIWPAARVGQRHVVTSPHGYIHCQAPAATMLESNCWDDPRPATLALEVVSTSPRVFLIQDLLSESECDHIVELGRSKGLARSVTASGGNTNTRTSSTGWVTRDQTPIVSRLFARFADVLGLPQADLDADKRAEKLQIVRYEEGQQYTPHHDFLEAAWPETRALTLLLHPHPADEGGATEFPKAGGGRGLKVKPPKGSAVLFYNMLPDGNADQASLHAGAPVLAGEKWACNLWVWDPKFKAR